MRHTSPRAPLPALAPNWFEVSEVSPAREALTARNSTRVSVAVLAGVRTTRLGSVNFAGTSFLEIIGDAFLLARAARRAFHAFPGFLSLLVSPERNGLPDTVLSFFVSLSRVQKVPDVVLQVHVQGRCHYATRCQSRGFDRVREWLSGSRLIFSSELPRARGPRDPPLELVARVRMSNAGNLEQQIASLQLGDEATKGAVKPGKKVGPAVPPKPKKSQPQIPQSYTIKAPPVPSYSTVLNNTSSDNKSSNLYMNAPSPYVPLDIKNDFTQMAPANGKEASKIYQNNDNLYARQPEEKFEPKYRYDEKNYYSNVGNMPAPQVPVAVADDRARGASRNAVYSNVEPPVPTVVSAYEYPYEMDKEIIYSNIQWNPKTENTYCNVSTAHGADDLPPPPEPSEYVSCVPGNSFPPPPEELPPPPSPVSSSYSELRRATYQTDFPSGNYPADIYGPSSQSSSTYESIYEPINPRPPSQLSCNYSMYSGYGSAASTQPQGKVSPVKEVDVLTDLLVQGMEDNNEDSDIYGICAQCGRKVEGEGTGCSAMDKVFHISCFCCFVCKVNLQGKPFYSLEGKPYCEEDYLNTLEKCCVCTRPILDRILRATGKPYHPSCFTCVVCGQSLDGIPFTVDATNQIHCIQCFHKKFAPRCCVCKLPIMPEPGQDETIRVVALDRSFHIQCYKCEDCGLVLSSDSEGHGCYPLDDHILCKSCNATRVQALTSHMTTEL